MRTQSHHLLFKTGFIGILCCFLLTMRIYAQTEEKEEIVISGVDFSRFVLKFETSASFREHKQSKQWSALVDKNLCWSGVFLISESPRKTCHTKRTEFDMQVLLKLQDQSEEHLLQFVIADKNNQILFQENIVLGRPSVEQGSESGDQLEETDLMNTINRLTEKITGTPGILGSTIAFGFKQPGRKKVIARVNTHGQKMVAVSKSQGISLLPKWSYDGNAIVYTVLSREGSSVLYDDLSQPPVSLASFRGVNSGGSWTTDGKSLVLTLTKGKNADLYMINRGNQQLKRLTKHWAIDTAPALSPDGQYLLFVSDRAGSEQIYIKHMSTQAIFRLTFDGVRNTDPAWSPDGKNIAFTKTVGYRNQIYLMSPFGDNIRSLTQGSYHSEQPAWSPDGTQIAFVSTQNREYKLYIMFVDGTGVRRLTNTPAKFEEYSPSWTQRRF